MTRNTARYRWVAVSAIITATLAGAASFHADAQSEYMRGDRMPYDAFDKLPKTDLDVSGGTIHVAFAPGDIALSREKLFDWIKASAKAVSTYYGRFPVSSLRLLIVPVDGARVRGGTTWGDIFMINGGTLTDPAERLRRIVQSGHAWHGLDLERVLHHEERHCRQWAAKGYAGMLGGYGWELARELVFRKTNRLEEDAGLSDGGYR